MAIVIQELLSADTISQAVDKINFNFDQIILNGGGPRGFAGPIGPTGPIGGRGEKGTVWYDDNNITPGVNPNSITEEIEGTFFIERISGTPSALNKDDYFLQSNGQVWQWSGSEWIDTGINLTGPQGDAGSAIGFSYAGGFTGSANDADINNQNVAYVSPMPGGLGSGANQVTNQSISAVLLGGVASNAVNPTGINITDAFKLAEPLTRKLDSSKVSVVIHQKNSQASAIKFAGGVSLPTDNYERELLENLSEIKLGTDDSLIINVPKAALPQNVATTNDLIGLSFNTINKGQRFFAGKQIIFESGGGGGGATSGLSDEISDVSFLVQTSNPNNPAKFKIATVGTGINSKFEIGGNISIQIPNNTAVTQSTGTALIDAKNVGIIGSTIKIGRNSSNIIEINTNGVGVTGKTKLNTVDPSTGPNELLVRNTNTNEIESIPGFPPIPAAFPLGGIIMWSGNSIPAGWALCNGQTKGGIVTPNLKSRFIVGFDPDDPNYDTIGKTGGLRAVTLTPNQLPPHTHTLNANRNLVGGEDFGRLGTGAQRAVIGRTSGGIPNLFNSGIGQNPTPNNQPHENRPPYYVLAFIMFVGTGGVESLPTPTPPTPPTPPPPPPPETTPPPEPPPVEQYFYEDLVGAQIGPFSNLSDCQAASPTGFCFLGGAESIT